MESAERQRDPLRTVTEGGQLINAYRKLSDIRKDYRVEIGYGLIELRRELNRTWGENENK